MSQSSALPNLPHSPIFPTNLFPIFFVPIFFDGCPNLHYLMDVPIFTIFTNLF